MPLLSPLQSPEVRDICAHLTKAESNQVSLLGLLFGVWIVAAIFGIPALVRSSPGPGSWIVASVLGILFVVSIPMLLRMARQFLCSTGWAKERGFTPDKLRLFSFRGGNLWKGIAVLAVGLFLIFAQHKAITRYLGLSGLPQSPQTRERQQENNAPHLGVAFGPVIERIVTDAINLDDGSLLEFPSTSSTNINVGLMMVESIRLAELKGVDAYVEGSRLFVLGMTLAPLPQNDWDSPHAVQLAYQAILSASATDKPPLVKLDPDKDGARTYAFKTREGGVGVLQITGYTDHPLGVKLRYKLVQAAAASSGSRKPEDSRRKFVRLVLDKAAMTFEGQPTTWDDVGALLEKVPERKNTVLECAVTSDQITVQQQNEWFGKSIALAISHGFEYASFIGVHPLGSKGTPASSGDSTGATRLPAASSTSSYETPRFTFAVELILPTGATDNRFLNLDSGDLLWALVTNQPMVEVRQDVGGGLSVAFHHQHALPIAIERSRQFWESTSADELMSRYRDQGFALLPFERNFVFPIQKEQLPMTFELPGAGILQVKEILDGNPPKVKLRYKLAQSAAARGLSSADSPKTDPPAAPAESPTVQKPLDPIPSANDLPGTLTFHGRYKHRSRGRDIETPSELWLKETQDGGLMAVAQLPFMGSTELAASDKGHRLTRHRIGQSASGNRPFYQVELKLGDGKVQLTRRGVRQDCDGKELTVPEGAWFDPNARPDSYCAANVLLRAFAVAENASKEFRVYDWDNSGEALVDYTIRVKHAGKERVEVPAGTFEANHLVLTQVTSANTWFKKRAGHVTDFWVLGNHVIVRILRHREPYEMVLLDYTVPAKLPGHGPATSDKAGGLK